MRCHRPKDGEKFGHVIGPCQFLRLCCFRSKRKGGQLQSELGMLGKGGSAQHQKVTRAAAGNQEDTINFYLKVLNKLLQLV